VYFNPAGITQLEGAQISLGVSSIAPKATFESDSGISTDAKERTFYIPNFYATLKATDKLSVGFAAFANFGLATEWPSDWEGRYITGGTKAEIVTLTLNPNIAYKLTDKLSLAVGLDIQKLEITLENILNVGFGDGPVQLKADDWAYGYNVALHYSVTENWKAGISYRSKIKHEIKDGTANVVIPTVGSFQRKGSADLTLPDILYIGTSYKLNKFTFEFDAQRTGWSSYDKLKVDYEPDVLSTTMGFPNTTNKPKDWEDAWAFRFGTQYQVNDMLALRAGIIRDYSPIPDETVDPLVPSGDRWLYAVGFGLNFENLTIDFAYNYMDDENRDFDTNNVVANEVGVYGEFKDVDAHIFGLNVTYRFK